MYSLSTYSASSSRRHLRSVLKKEEGTSVNLGAVMKLEASVVKSLAMAEKHFQTFVPPTDKKMSEKMELDELLSLHAMAMGSFIVDRAKKMRDETKELTRLKKDKEDSDIAAKKLENEVAKLKMRENLTKKLAVDELKASEEYKETMEEEASSYFGEGFNKYKKQLNLLVPNLDIDDQQIDPDLVDGDEDEVDEGKVVVQNTTLPG
ncbi:hypothetical protein Acr_16g0000920 [Actinidia rufa]|uniref:Uncharacterized protein n=1 Tax=Actinidia rufa TaxID=165716 RepID=A0A7J0FZW9_9ERIC|nr:hypothetical protein Acr_16g0000920 [Actinidia rufa]